MKYPCDMVQDLLPLYHDEVCSPSSKKIVEEHLPACEACQSILKQIENDTCSQELRQERTAVVGRYTQRVKRRSLLVGLCLSAVLALPVLVCLICNLAVGRALDWFFIVLTALMVFASLTVVPLVVETKKLLWTLGSFTTSLLLLLLTCCLYVGGDWFFVAAVPILFGLSVLFLPFVLSQLPLRGFAARQKGLIAMAVDTALLYAVIITSGLYAGGAGYWKAALSITSVCAAVPWALFILIRYLKTNGLVKAGLCTAVCGVFMANVHSIVAFLTGIPAGYTLFQADLLVWNNATINPNCYLIILLGSLFTAALLLLLGFLRRGKKQNKNS